MLVVGITSCANPAQFSEITSKPILENQEDIADVLPSLQPPTLVFVQFPNGPVVTYEDTTIIYEIIAGSAPIVSVVCKVDGVVVPCSTQGDTLIVKNPVEANHVVEIVVTDANNLQDTGSISWESFNKFQKVKSPLVINEAEAQVDILVAIDNSKSMKDEQKNMAQKINNLLDRVNGLDWRIGVITTDMKHQTLGDGRLLPFANGDYYITSQLSLVAAKEQFGKTIQRSENGDFEEQGIKATYRAIERSLVTQEANDKYNKSFFRKDAALAVIVISDENETGTSLQNTPAGLATLIRSAFGKEKIFKFHSIIVRPGDKQCFEASPDHGYGDSYAVLTKATEGILGDICAQDYGNQLKVIGQNVANTQNTFVLNCAPMDIDGDGVQEVNVLSSSGVVAPTFKLEGDKIIFSKPPQKGQYSIEYFCPK